MAVYKPITAKQYAPSSERTGGAVVPYSSGAVVPYSPPTRAVSVQPAVQDRGSAGVIGRSFATFGDVVANILTGAAKSLEGIVDLGMTGVGAVGGIFSDEFQDAVRKHVEYDFVGTHIGDPLQELTGESYLNDLRIGKYNVGEAVELIAQGVGGMLPSIGLAMLTGGGSLAAQIAGTGSMMAGAAGNATEEAFESDASYGSAAAYGLARGAIEGVTEYLGGVTLGGGTSLIGKKLAGTALGEAVQKGAGRLAYTFISEGAEEVLSDLSDPLAKYVTGVDKNIGENYKDIAKGLPQTFLVGGSVGSLMGGAQDFLRSHTKEQAARGGGAATRSDHFLRNVIEIGENEGKGADAERFEAAKLSSYQAMSSELVRMSDEHRAKYLDSIGVHKLAFDDKGQLVAKVAENANAEAVSPALRSLSGNLVHAPIGADVQVSESAATAKDTVLKAVGKRANVVITDALVGDNALYNPREDVIYISNGALDGSTFNTEDVARAIALHEVAHKAEGTEAFGRMAYELERILKDEKAPEDVKALVGDYRARRAGLSKLYTDKNQSKAQNEYVVSTELVANMAGDLLGNSYFVERMGARNDGAWKRFVLALKAAHDGKAAGISKEAQKYLSGLYKSYVKAVDAAGSGVKVSSITDEREKEKAAEGAVNERKAKKGGLPSKKEVVFWPINWDDDNFSGLKTQLARGAGELREMRVVTSITFEHMTGKELAQRLDEIVRNNFGYRIETKNCGAINFDPKAIDGITSYVNNDAEAAALLALPYVLKRGKAITGHKNHKGKGFPSVTFAAPVEINGERAIVAVVVLYGDKGRAHSARILDPDGGVFVLKKKIDAESTPAGNTSKKGAMSAINSAPNNSISQNSEMSTENPKKVSDERKSKKAYRRADASATLEETVKELFAFTDAYASLKGKSKKEATDILWKALNTAEDEQARERAALDVADFVLDNMVMETLEANQNVQKAADTIAVLKPYYRKLDLDDIRGEIKKRFGKETAPYLLWGKQKGQEVVSLETVFAELSEKGIFLSSTDPAEIFFEIYDMDKKAKGVIEESANTLLRKSISAEEREGLRKKISKDILQAYEEKGTKPIDFNLFHRKLSSAEGWAEYWKKRYLNEVDRNHITNRILDKARRLDDIKKGAFMGATQSRVWVEKFQGSIFRLSQIRFLGNLNTVGTRRICAKLEAWYTDENNELVKSAPHLYDEGIAVVLKELARNERAHTEAEDAILDGLMTRFKTSDLKKLHELYTVKNLGKEYDANVKLLLRELSSEVIFDTEELRMLESVIDHFTHFSEKFNLVYRKGEYVKASDLAKGYIKKFTERKRGSPGTLRKWFEAYYASYGDPMALVRYMDCYDKHGFFTESLEEIRRAGIEAAVLEMKIFEPVEKFYSEHKRFLGDLKAKTVKAWGGAEIPLAKAISLYMTLGRDQAILGLARKGYAFKLSEEAKEMRVEGFAPIAEIADDQLAAAAKEARDNLYKQFTEDEKKYIGLVEEALARCKDAKHETDMIRHGYSNTIEGYYFPIARAYVSHSIDATSIKDELDCVSSKSFNKDTVEKAAGELWINDVDAILNRHVRGVSQYAKLSTVIDTFDVLYSLNVNEDAGGKVQSIKTESTGVWAENENYFKKLISDVQGIRLGGKDTVLDKLLPALRSGYAKYLLGANPKVWVTQLSSLAASTSILDADCLMKGFSFGTKDVDEFCALAQLRNTDNSAALAQGVLENVSGFGDVLMKPIGAVDRFVIGRLFAACQVQVAKNGDAALGTKENKVKAGELLERVILETQQNSLATERSAAMRSENEINKTVTMFSADAMKVIGRVIDAFGEASTLRRMLKLSKGSSETTRLQKELKRAEKRVRRSVGALLSSAVLMALIAQLVRRLLNKKDKDEVAKNIAGDVAGNLIGGLPLIRDVASYFMDGYDIDYYAFSAMNDLLKSTSEIFALGQDAIEGDWDSRKTAKVIRNAFYSAGMVLGVPVRNVYNYSYGVINIVSPETGYRMDDLFYSKSYRADLAAAIEKGDEGMVATIAGLMMDNGVGGMTNKALRQTMRDLIAAGYDVVPRSVKSSFTFEGQVFELDSKQKKAFEKTYAQAHEVAAQLVKLKDFASASEAVKAKAIGFVYDLYYDTAIRERVGDGSLGKSALFAKAIDVPILALVVATAKNLESDKDKTGKTVAGSLKKKVHDYVAAQNLTAAQKYMLMGYLGYKNTLGEDKVKAYIQTLKLSAEQKETLIEESGY